MNVARHVPARGASGPSMASTSTGSKIAQATALLETLTPADVSGEDAAALREVGIALFGRAAIKKAYGDKEVVTAREYNSTPINSVPL